MQNLRLALPLVFLSACAAAPSAPADAEAKAKTCEREYRVGSNIPVLNCSAPKTDEERQQMIDDLRNGLRSVPATPRSGSGG